MRTAVGESGNKKAMTVPYKDYVYPAQDASMTSCPECKARGTARRRIASQSNPTISGGIAIGGNNPEA
jgi:hypothetical protein